MPVTTPASAIIYIPQSTPPVTATSDAQNANAIDAVSKWLSNLQHRVGSPTDFNDNLVVPSNTNFDAAITFGTTKKGMTDANMKTYRSANLAASYDKFSASIAAMAAPGPGGTPSAMAAALLAKKDNWALVAAKLGFNVTGEVASAKGVAVAISYILTGDARGVKLCGVGDTLVNMPYRVPLATVLAAWRASFMGAFIKAYCISKVSVWNVPVVLAMNTALKDILNMGIDAARANEFAIPDVSPDSGFTISGGGTPKVTINLRLGAP